MKKRVRILMPMLVTLAMLVFLFSMAIPALASEITATKDVTDPFAVNIYYVGDTIYYEMTVENPPGNDETNTLTRIWDTLPDGTVIEFLTPPETLVQAPGAVDYFYAEYLVAEADLGWIIPTNPLIDPYWGVKNEFEAEGYDTAADDVYAKVMKNSQVIRPELSIEKLVDFDADATFTDSETYYAGEPADWYIEVTNTGFDPVYEIYVSDDNMGADFYGPFDLDRGDSEIIPVYTTNPMVNTVNTACAEGVDDLGNPVGPVCDSAEVVVVVIEPCIDIEKSTNGQDADSPTGPYIPVGDPVAWEYVVTNCGNVPLSSITVTDSEAGVTPAYVSGDTNTDSLLDLTETWIYQASGTAAAGQYANIGTATGTPPVGAAVDDTDPSHYFGANPHTIMLVFSYVWETTPYGNVELTIQDQNDGNVPLTDCVVHLYANSVEYAWSPLGNTGLPAWVTFSESGTADGIMEVDEIWTWVVHVNISVDTTFEVQGEARFEPLNLIADGPSEYASVTIEVGGATRTWGFWKTHLWLVEWMFDPAGGNITLPINLGTWPDINGDPSPKLIDTVCEYMGLMWSKQSQNSDGGKREKIDAARVHTAHQALAAIMNYYMPGGAPLPAGITLTSIADTLTNGNIKQIRDLGSALANYNESGDDVALDPSMPPTGRTNNADPQGARDVGASCEDFWDTPEATKGVPKGKGKK